ncbi:MAG: S8 family serine peptidase [Candidatus Eisenbacteria bacterium]
MSALHRVRFLFFASLVLVLAASAAAAASRIEPLPGKIHPRLAQRMAKETRPVSAWVFFDGKEGGTPSEATARARARRAKVGHVLREEDAPVAPGYVRAVREAGAAVRHRSRWLNAVSVRADRNAIERIARLPFVVRIQEVARVSAPPPPPAETPKKRSLPPSLDYGLSDIQLAQIKTTPLLEAGYSGEGVHILMLDSGFYTAAPCFSTIMIERRRDFVDGDDFVDGLFIEDHGTQTLSVIGGYDPGWIVGPARDATYYLARTEDTWNEVPAEEDNWIAALEWGESLGVDLASSSVGYIDWYDYEDMDGATAPISIAAEAAVERGMVVVNSAGNEGSALWHYIIAPADAPGVIAAAAVNINGDRVGFSSYGPTADGRIKPDLAALGSGVAGVVDPRESAPIDIYGESLSGTSYSAPLIAGACALLLEIHPLLTPALLADALKSTASQKDDPDTSLGWGIVNAYQAALLPVVRHEPSEDVAWNGIDGHAVDLRLSLYPGFDPPRAVYGGGEAFSDTVPILSEGGNDYSCVLPTAYALEPTRYHFLFTRNDTTYTVPRGAPASYYEIGDATPPRIAHAEIGRYPFQEWPAEVVAIVTDVAPIEEDSVYVDYRVLSLDAKAGPLVNPTFPLARRDDSTFAGTFPSAGAEDASIQYRIHACDVNGNCAVLPAQGSFSAGLYSVTYALHYGSEEEEGPTNPFISGGGESYRVFFDLPAREDVRIRIYDVAGRLLREVWNGPMRAGERLAVDWDGKDAGGRRVRSGVYFLRFEAGPFTATRRLVVLR